MFSDVKLFKKSPETFSYDLVEFFLKNYFRFLGDVKYSWKESINVSLLWELMNSLDPDIKFIFENVSTVSNFLDVSCSIKDDQLWYLPQTYIFVLLRALPQLSPVHNKNNIVLSLGQRIIRIVSENKEQHFNKLKSCLTRCGHPEEITQSPNFSHHHSKVKMNRLTILLLFRLTILTLSVTKILLTIV